MSINQEIMSRMRLGTMVCLGALMSYHCLVESHDQAAEGKAAQTVRVVKQSNQKETMEIVDAVLGRLLRDKEMSSNMQSVHFGSRETHVHKDGLLTAIYKADKRIITKLDVDKKHVEGYIFSTDSGYMGYVENGNVSTYFADTPKGTLTMRFQDGKPQVMNHKTGESVQWQEFAPYYNEIDKRLEENRSFKFIDSYQNRTITMGLDDEYNGYNSDEVNKKALAKEEADRKKREKDSFTASIHALEQQQKEKREQDRKRYVDLSRKMAAWSYLLLLVAQGLSALTKKNIQKQYSLGVERDI